MTSINKISLEKIENFFYFIVYLCSHLYGHPLFYLLLASVKQFPYAFCVFRICSKLVWCLDVISWVWLQLYPNENRWSDDKDLGCLLEVMRLVKSKSQKGSMPGKFPGKNMSSPNWIGYWSPRNVVESPYIETYEIDFRSSLCNA